MTSYFDLLDNDFKTYVLAEIATTGASIFDLYETKLFCDIMNSNHFWKLAFELAGYPIMNKELKCISEGYNKLKVGADKFNFLRWVSEFGNVRAAFLYYNDYIQHENPDYSIYLRHVTDINLLLDNIEYNDTIIGQYLKGRMSIDDRFNIDVKVILFQYDNKRELSVFLIDDITNTRINIKSPDVNKFLKDIIIYSRYHRFHFY